MVGEARAFVRFDEGVVRLTRARHHEVDPDNRNANGLCGFRGGIDKTGMNLSRDIMDRSTRMQIRGASHLYLDTFFGCAVQ